MTTRKHITNGFAIIALVLAGIAATGTNANAALVTSMSNTAPSTDILFSQTKTDVSNINWRNRAGSEDWAGQTFNVDSSSYPLGVEMEKVTVKIASVEWATYDGKSVSLRLYSFADQTAFTPESPQDFSTPIAKLDGTLPSNMRDDVDAGNNFLTFTLDEAIALDAGTQYGFLLTDLSSESSTSNMKLFGTFDTSSYADGIGIQHQGGGPLERMQAYDGSSFQDADLTFYVQGTAIIPEPTTALLLMLGGFGLMFRRSRRRA